jgi:hypothetical protein
MKYVISLFVVTLLLIQSQISFAVVEPTPTPRPLSGPGSGTGGGDGSGEGNQQGRNRQLTANVSELCTKVGGRIDEITDKYQRNKSRYVNRYRVMIDRLERVIESLERDNINTLNVSESFEKLKNEIATLEEAINNIIALARETKDSACEEKGNNYRSKFEEMRKDNSKIREQNKRIRKIITNEIVPELRKIQNNIN